VGSCERSDETTFLISWICAEHPSGWWILKNHLAPLNLFHLANWRLRDEQRAASLIFIKQKGGVPKHVSCRIAPPQGVSRVVLADTPVLGHLF
jgi:hypothetical protein